MINRANQILEVYENKERKRDIKIQQALSFDEMVKEESVIEQELEKINPLEITPLEALNVLYKLKEEMKKNK